MKGAKRPEILVYYIKESVSVCLSVCVCVCHKFGQTFPEWSEETFIPDRLEVGGGWMEQPDLGD